MKCELLLLLFLGVINQGVAIRITRFVVPTIASYGSLVDLDCAYDLENDRLYDVKWYKDSDEFFRCKSDGQVQAFEVEGIDLYKSHRATLGSCPVTVTIVNSKSAGKYVCEVSSEAPEFKTTARWVILKIGNTTPSKRIQAENDYSSPQHVNNNIVDQTTNLTPATQASTQSNGGSRNYFHLSFRFLFITHWYIYYYYYYYNL